jgi:hypothetical protein
MAGGSDGELAAPGEGVHTPAGQEQRHWWLRAWRVVARSRPGWRGLTRASEVQDGSPARDERVQQGCAVATSQWHTQGHKTRPKGTRPGELERARRSASTTTRSGHELGCSPAALWLDDGTEGDDANDKLRRKGKRRGSPGWVSR